MSTPKKIKVLECIRQGQIGGGESHLLSLVENLNRDEFEPVVLSFTDGPMIERCRALNVPTTVIYTERPFDFRKWGLVKRFIQENGINLIHAHGTRANSNIIWAARKLNVPVVYTIHGWSFHQDQNPLVKQVRIWGEKYLTAKSTVNISVSESNRQSGLEFIPGFKSQVVNNGIDQRKFDPGKTFSNIREEFGIKPDAILILFIARFTAHKQPLSLLEAFSKAFQENQNLHLLMVGDGDQKEEAQQWVMAKGLQPNITFSGFRQDVPDVLAAADIFVLPSLWEGLPIGLLEAMAMGKAVIATRVDGTREVLVDGENGKMIETENLVENLTHALLDLASNPEQRVHFGMNAVNTVKNRFNATVMTREIENIYRRLKERNILN